MKKVMYEKARQAQLCYEDLKAKTGLDPACRVTFRVDPKQKAMMKRACFNYNPFPGSLKLVLYSLRKKSVARLFREEKVLQTGPAAAALALDAALAQEIGCLRLHNTAEEQNGIICDVGFAGLQAVRLYMCASRGNRAFLDCRCRSAFCAEQKQKSFLFKLRKLPRIRKSAFYSDTCGSMAQSREQWENSPEGLADRKLPLYSLKKEANGLNKAFGKMDSKKGPLSGIRVLDLTCGITGPSAARLLAEYGADVLMIRGRGFTEQEQAMQEMDGWAGKMCIFLDLKDPGQLAKARKLIREADVVICQEGKDSPEDPGFSPADIHRMNPNAVYASAACLQDMIRRKRTGWTSCAEDITGLSLRNGSGKRPENLNGLPVEYVSGMILSAGILNALKLQITEGGSYTVLSSQTRSARWLHECTDLWEAYEEDPDQNHPEITTSVNDHLMIRQWKRVFHKVPWTAVGDVFFPAPATWSEGQDYAMKNMRFTEEKCGFRN